MDADSPHPRRACHVADDGVHFVATVVARGKVYVGPCVGSWRAQLRRWADRDGYELVERE